MSHNVESMFYCETIDSTGKRFVPWHGLGTPVTEAPTSADAIRLAGLDWNVQQKTVEVDGVIVPGYKANVRDSDDSVLGIVSDRYKIVQNYEAFDFTDSLLDGDVRYETAGSLKNGKVIWLLAQLPKRNVLGDDIANFLCFTNSHDGSGAIKVCMTPTRVVCNNTLNIAFANAKRVWSTKHVGNISSKLAEAQNTLELASNYMDKFVSEAERLANTNISNDEIAKILDEMFRVSENDSDRKKQNAKDAKEAIYTCMMAPDLYKFLGTKWGFLNAVSDFADHGAPKRNTVNYQDNNWGRVLDGHPILDLAYALVNNKE